MRKSIRLWIALAIFFSGAILTPYVALSSDPIRWQSFSDAYQPMDEFVFLPFVAKDQRAIATIIPNDPLFEGQWGLHNMGQIPGMQQDADIDAPEAWTYATGSRDVIVAVLDTGVDLSHPEFSGRLVAGWDYANEDNDPSDDHGHGTHVAGIAAAAGNNGIGVAGTAWNVRIMPLKVLNSEGKGNYSMMINAINYAINNGARVINMSLVGTSDSQALQDAVTTAYDNGVLVVAAAGNCGGQDYKEVEGCDYQDQPKYPAAHSNVLAVASTTPEDRQSSFSNQGWYVDVAAPGTSILSTGWTGNSGCEDGYCFMSGTSMATPFVAGVAALVYSRYPHYSADQVAQAIMQNVDDLGVPGWDELYGWGRMNAFASLMQGVHRNNYINWQRASESLEGTKNIAYHREAFRSGVLLVKFKESASVSTQQNILDDYGLNTIATIDELGINLIAVPEGLELAFMDKLNVNPQVLYAEPDYEVSLR
jgi:type VII secretion-associated serine protease mycosin